MKDFDVARQARAESDRSFKIGGEHFVAKASVRPEVLLAFEEMGDTSQASRVIEIVDATIEAMIEPNDDALERYRALRAREEDPISLDDLQNVALWLMEVFTGRPIVLPGGSSAGPGSTGTTSTDSFSSEDNLEAQAA